MGSFPVIEDEFTTIQQNMIDLIDPTEMEFYLHDKSLAPIKKVPVCITAAVYRMSAGNSMPYTGHNNKTQIGLNNQLQSPWETYRQKHKSKVEDSSSCSTIESTCSSRSDSPEPKHHHRHHASSRKTLLREIRRLRGENAFLNSSVSILKNDLRDTTTSRQNSDIIHQRIHDEYELRHQALEDELLIERDEVRRLKEQVEQLQLAAYSFQQNNQPPTSSPSYFKTRKNSNSFGCYEFEEDDESMSCQPVAHESALPEVTVKMDELKTTDEQMVNDYFKRRLEDNDDYEFSPEEEEEEEEAEHDVDLEPFDVAAASYLHQAVVARLSSARVRLDFDDLILKHEPPTDTVMTVLAEAFVNWVCFLWAKPDNKSLPAQKFLTSQIQPGLCDFWKSILQCYALDYESQVQLLNGIENQAKQVDKTGCPLLLTHFDRLVLCLFSSEVIEREVVLSWHANPVNDKISKDIRNTTITTRLIDFLEEDDDEEEEEEEEDDDDVYENDDDEHDICSFEFMDSTIPEEDEEVNFVFAHDQDDTESINNHVEEQVMAASNPCICRFDYDNDTTQDKNAKKNVPFSSHESTECSCESTYPPVTEKKKKSVRIAM